MKKIGKLLKLDLHRPFMDTVAIGNFDRFEKHEVITSFLCFETNSVLC